MDHLTSKQLEAGLDAVCRSPKGTGTLELIVRRPSEGERKVLEAGELDETLGLIGDNWKTRASRHTPDGSAHPEMQINIMNARAVALIAGDKDNWPIAGDQLYIDLDLSGENLPPGTRLELGSAVLQVTEIPHRGCKKFTTRFGLDAMKFVNSPRGIELNVRGINARVVQSGEIRVGDAIKKL